jgi:transcriptional regulator GlxA family with amidase domain
VPRRPRSALDPSPRLVQPTLGPEPFSRPPEDGRAGGRTDYRIRRALQIMERDHSQPVRASQVAAAVGLSRSRFEHLFKGEAGAAFRPMLRMIRLAEAERLIADPRVSIKQVAARVGFRSAAAFSRAFKKRFGEPPSNWRRSTFGQL